MLVQLWQAEKARDLVSGLIAAAGPDRIHVVDHLFEKLRTRVSWSGQRKVEYLEEVRDNLATNPFYSPGDRLDIAAAMRARRDKLITAIKRNGGRITRKNALRYATRNVIQPMLQLGEIIPLGVGEYGLPGGQIHFSASRMIFAKLAAIADHRMERTELPCAIGRNKHAVDRGIKVLHRNGLVRIDGNMIELSPKALQRMQNNEVVRLRKGTIVWGEPVQLDLFAATPQT